MQVTTDIETIPQQPEEEVKKEIAATISHPAQMTKPETIEEWHTGVGKYAGVKAAAIEEAYRKTALDGSKGQICCIAWGVEDGEPNSIFATPGVTTEADLLRGFFSAVKDETKSRPPVFAGHFLGGFDLPYIFQRAVINQVEPPFDLGQWGRHGHQFFDTMVAWAGWKGHISLDALCLALGIKIPSPEGLEGGTVYDFYKAGKYGDIQTYNMADVKKAQAILRRLQFRG